VRIEECGGERKMIPSEMHHMLSEVIGSYAKIDPIFLHMSGRRQTIGKGGRATGQKAMYMRVGE